MDQFAKDIQILNETIYGGTAVGTLLVITFFRYGKDSFFTMLGDVFIKFSLVKRDRRDLLVFALIPYSMAILAIVCRIMLL